MQPTAYALPDRAGQAGNRSRIGHAQDRLPALLDRTSDVRQPIGRRVAAWAELTQSLDAAYSAAQHDLSARRLDRIADARDTVLQEALRPALLAAGVRFFSWRSVAGADAEGLRAVFMQRVHPVLTPMAVDGARPSLSVPPLVPCLAVTVAALGERGLRLGCVPLPARLPRVFEFGAGRVVTLETLVAANLGSLFVGTRIVDCAAFRVTRDRVGRISRVELEQSGGPHVRAELPQHLNTDPGRIRPVRTALALGDALSPALDLLRAKGRSR